MDDARKLNFGPRYSPELDWVHEDGTPADPDDVGLVASIDEDGAIRLAIGGKLGQESWELSARTAHELARFLLEAAGEVDARTLLHRGG